MSAERVEALVMLGQHRCEICDCCDGLLTTYFGDEVVGRLCKRCSDSVDWRRYFTAPDKAAFLAAMAAERQGQ